jgi:hypothetical protein
VLPPLASETKFSVTKPLCAPATLVLIPTERSVASVAPGASFEIVPLAVASPLGVSVTSRSAAPASALFVTSRAA